MDQNTLIEMNSFPGSFDLIVNSHEFDFGPFSHFGRVHLKNHIEVLKVAFKNAITTFLRFFAVIEPSESKNSENLNGFLYILRGIQESQDMSVPMKDISLDSSCKLK